MSLLGTTIGHIRIEARLGTGGMGEVHLGFDPRLERRVAVKAIRPEQRLNRQIKARFLREARLLSKLEHPGICQVYDLLETPEADFLILEYVEGQTLRQLAAAGGLGFEDKLRLGEKIAAALAAAHREKIVHRDLKPDNVMVTPQGEVKVLDFGIARSLAEPDIPVIHPPPPLPEPGGTGALTQSRLAKALKPRDPESARTQARRSETTVLPLLMGDVDEPTRGLIAAALVERGRIETVLGSREAARAAFQRALDVLAPCRRPITHWKLLAPQAQALQELGRTTEARPLLQRLEAMGYRGAD